MAKEKEIIEPESAPEPKIKNLGIRVLTDVRGVAHEYSVEQIGDAFHCTPHSFSGEVEIRNSIE